jgi:hypothetical protein
VTFLVRAGVVVVAAYVLGVLPAAAQPPAPPTPTTPTPGTLTPPAESPTGVTEGPTPSGILPSVQIPGVLLPPRNVLDFLYAPPAQGPLTLTPSLAITEEFNDNVFLTHSNKRSDFITQFTPGLTLQAQQPGFQLLSSFNFTAEIYAKETELNNAANRIYFLTSVSYQATPSVTLSLTETLTFSRDNSNTATISGVSSGRGESWSNILAPAVSVQLTPRTTWRVSGAYTLERFSSNSGSNNRGSNNGSNNGDSNIYRVGTGLDHTLTPRLTLTAAYDFGYLDVEQEPTAFNHTLRLGGSYRLTPTLTVTGTAGPSLLLTDRDTEITPSASARIIKQMSWGSMSAFYDRAIGTSGGFGGLSDNQTIGGNITVSTLLRGLYLDLSPRYSMTKTTGASRSNSDINTLTVTLTARYQIARYIGLVGGYSYLHQTGSGNGNTGTSGTSGTSNDVDVDQNRVTFGIQFGYPINFY